MRRKRSLLENVGFLVIVGIVAGAIGGLAIGVITGRTPSTSATAPK